MGVTTVSRNYAMDFTTSSDKYGTEKRNFFLECDQKYLHPLALPQPTCPPCYLALVHKLRFLLTLGPYAAIYVMVLHAAFNFEVHWILRHVCLRRVYLLSAQNSRAKQIKCINYYIINK